MNKLHKIIHHPLTPVFFIDIITVCLFIVACALIGETILPGIIYRYVSPVTLYGLLFALCIFTIFLTRAQNLSFTPQKNISIFTILGFSFFIGLTAIACIRYGTFLTGIMIFLMSIFFWLAHKLYRDELYRS